MQIHGRNGFIPDTPLVGYPRFERENPFEHKGTLPLQRQSYLSQLQRRFEPEREHFGLGDHISVPLSRLQTQLTAPVTSTVEGLFSRLRGLKTAAAPLVSGTPSGVFDRRQVTSSQAGVSATMLEGAAAGSYAVDVQQVAVAQQNVGTQVVWAEEPAAISVGLNTVAITSGGVTTNVDVTIGAADTNLQALTRVRDAVNAASSAVEASLSVNQDVASLILTARRTGTDAAFDAVDVTGNVVTATGTGTTTTNAQDAQVRVDGRGFTLQRNQLHLDQEDGAATGRIALFFHGATHGTALVDVRVSLDAGSVVAATRRLLDAANDTREYVEDKPDILSRGLISRLNVAIDSLRQSLPAIGITPNATGSLTLNEALLREGLERRPDQVERAIGSLQGLAAHEHAVAEAVLSNTSLAFSSRPGPLGAEYGRFLMDTARLHNFVLGGLFVDVLA